MDAGWSRSGARRAIGGDDGVEGALEGLARRAGLGQLGGDKEVVVQVELNEAVDGVLEVADVAAPGLLHEFNEELDGDGRHGGLGLAEEALEFLVLVGLVGQEMDKEPGDVAETLAAT